MNNLKLKPITTLAAACVLSLMSASVLAERGGNAGGAAMRGSGAATATTRATAPMTRATTAPTAKPATAATARSTKTARTTTGQPNASCEDTPNQPGNSMSAPGSAFNPDGVAGTHYAGEQPQNSRNPKSVSQYDVACARNHSH